MTGDPVMVLLAIAAVLLTSWLLDRALPRRGTQEEDLDDGTGS